MLSNTSTPSCTFFSTLSISPWSFRVAPMTPLKDSQTPSLSHFQPPFPNTLPRNLDHAKGWRLLQRLQSLSVLIIHLLPTPPFFVIELPKASITSTLARETPPSQQFRSSKTISKWHRFWRSLALPKAWNLSNSIPAPSNSCVKDRRANFEVQRNSIDRSLQTRTRDHQTLKGFEP
jgi:hypothetical protein